MPINFQEERPEWQEPEPHPPSAHGFSSAARGTDLDDPPDDIFSSAMLLTGYVSIPHQDERAVLDVNESVQHKGRTDAAKEDVTAPNSICALQHHTVFSAFDERAHTHSVGGEDHLFSGT